MMTPEAPEYIPFKKVWLSGQEGAFMQEALANGHLAGDGPFSRRAANWLKAQYQFADVLLTPSCTDALEMAALLLNLQPGDEVIVPSYTFVTTASVFASRGARVVFADSQSGHPNMDLHHAEQLITPRTKALVLVHYGGMACNPTQAQALARKHGLVLIEDAAHAIDARWEGKPLGSFGDLAVFSFHETKNVICGEGGALVLNKTEWQERAYILWEKGTNRRAFQQGDVAKYEWIEPGSSFLLAEPLAAFLLCQLGYMATHIQPARLQRWQQYYQRLSGFMPAEQLPEIHPEAQQNGSVFYLLCQQEQERNQLISQLKKQNIEAAFHYLPLHQSPYIRKSRPEDIFSLPHAERFGRCLLRLPLYPDLTEQQTDRICQAIELFFGGNWQKV